MESDYLVTFSGRHYRLVAGADAFLVYVLDEERAIWDRARSLPDGFPTDIGPLCVWSDERAIWVPAKPLTT